MKRPGPAHSLAWRHHEREIQLGSRIDVVTYAQARAQRLVLSTEHAMDRRKTGLDARPQLQPKHGSSTKPLR
ncbi:hypothetical protein T265_00564 [Opisthorchis viverrini]|uniref:Uncharacterized protein n=1 Tax=Opisthorchis viverrini TaxID=6198 RepID=A0A075A5X2_OPIVI|nr:hypothetical protein T265_00564 [Opisthorchis viverrini]KER33682.1 hypothetical protein T265_00564 [Opisthorchis viverrini]